MGMKKRRPRYRPGMPIPFFLKHPNFKILNPIEKKTWLNISRIILSRLGVFDAIQNAYLSFPLRTRPFFLQTVLPRINTIIAKRTFQLWLANRKLYSKSKRNYTEEQQQALCSAATFAFILLLQAQKMKNENMMKACMKAYQACHDNPEICEKHLELCFKLFSLKELFNKSLFKEEDNL